MDQRNVYHYHHHHYHYHYTYPFPPGLPPNAPQNNEPLNREAAGHDNDELSAEDEQEENEEEHEEEYEEEIEEEHSERDDIEDQQNPEDRSPSPVQQNDALTKIDLSRVGLAVFDDYFSIFNLDAQSAKAQARWTSAQSNNEDHQEGPPRKKARASTLPERPISRGETSNSTAQPQQSNHITIIDKALVIDSDKGFRVFNCDPSGPQVNICYRVPGPRNLWLGRIGDPTDEPLKAIMSLMAAERQPGFTPTTFIMSPADAENTISMILCSSSDRNYDDFERGEGCVVCTGSSNDYMSGLGRLVGFEVVRGYAYTVNKGV